jgi:DNA polymerase III subunit alpha
VTGGNFVHLSCHSAYSLSEGAIKPDKLAGLAAQHGMPAVAITDTANLFGALEFSQACTGRGVQPIIGCQLALSRTEAERRDGPRPPADRLVLLAQNATGLANLMKLSSAAFLETEAGDAPQVTLARLAAHAEGLMLLTGGAEGPLGRLLAEGQAKEANALAAALHEAFGPDRMVVEIERHGTDLERASEPHLLALAERMGLPIVATNNVFYGPAAMHEAHDALLAIASGKPLASPDRRRVTPEHWFKPADAMRKLFADLPDAADNTLSIARLCAVMAETRKPLLPVSPKVRGAMTEAETVRAMAAEGLAIRLANVPEAERAKYTERLEYELGVIERMGFAGYFLIVADFIQWAKAHGIPVGPGRGSGAGSVAAWALAITDLDPLRWGLLFERFLNPERVSMPDFDIDFCQDRRDEVIRYVQGEYGSDRVAQIITFGKLQARAVVRDVGRVLELPYGRVNEIATLIPNNPAKPTTLQQAIDGEPRLQEFRDRDEAVKRLLEIALQLEGLYRHASTHAAGVVIGDRPLAELVPLYKDPRSDFLVTQYSMKHVEAAGLVKFDFLGLKTLTVLQRAEKFLAEQGTPVDLNHLPLDDEKTFAMLQRGDAGGVFQFESAGMRDVLRQMKPDRFEDLIAAVALYRPGPMANIPAYCARKHGEPWAAPHPAIHQCLAETYGIMVYQEQVMQISQVAGGYSLGAADLLRRAMGKKIRAEMEAQRKIFTDGAEAKGIPAAKAVEIFDLMERFADYGFNKSHAAAYAMVAYQTAWLKANHPVAFLAASMSLDIGNTDKLAAFKQEAATMGVAILPPCVNASGADFRIERGADGGLAVRYALAAIKKVGAAAMEGIVAAQPFASLADFADRTEPTLLNRQQVENLARAGAFDRLDANRARLVASAETILKRAQGAAEARSTNQIALFGGPADAAAPLRLPDLADWPTMDRLAQEREAIGFHLSAHPLDDYGRILKRLGVVPCAFVAARAAQGATRLKLAGSVVDVKERTTSRGTRMAWVRLSDASGGVEVTVFSEVLNAARDLIKPGAMLILTTTAKLEGEALRLTVEEVEPLDRAAASAGEGMRVWLEGTAALPHIRALLDQAGRGRGRVVLLPKLDITEADGVEVALPGGWQVTPRLAQALKVMPGVAHVEEV